MKMILVIATLYGQLALTKATLIPDWELEWNHVKRNDQEKQADVAAVKQFVNLVAKPKSKAPPPPPKNSASSSNRPPPPPPSPKDAKCTPPDTEETAPKDSKKAPPPPPPTPPKYYEPVDWSDKRMAPVCRLSVVLSGQYQCRSCSCSFVKQDLVATAAHCLTDAGVSATSGHVLFVQSKFEKGDDAFTKSPPNIVTEWWYPTAYKPVANQECDVIAPYDVAFLRTTSPGPATYTLMSEADIQPCKLVGTNVAVIGYPKNFHSNQKAALTTGTVHKDKEYLEIENDAAPTDQVKQPMMGPGGSGGPVILSAIKGMAAAALCEKTAKGLLEKVHMAQLSILGLGCKEEFKDKWNINGALVVTPALVHVMTHIHAKGTEGAEVKAGANGSLVKFPQKSS